MPGAVSEEDATDSRTASIASSRPRTRNASNRGAQTSLRKNRKQHRDDIAEFIPKGTRFTDSVIAADNESQRSSTDSSVKEIADPSLSRTPSGGIQPSVSWNKCDKGAIRTKLRTSGAGKPSMSNSFEEINGKYWGGRSPSDSNGDHNDQLVINEDENRKNSDNQDYQPIVIDSSSGSESGEISETDDKIVLNMGRVDRTGAVGDAGNRTFANRSNGQRADERSDGEDQEDMHYTGTPGQTTLHNGTSSSQEKKDVATRLFSHKYARHPQTLGDLRHEDLELQAKYVFYNLPVKELDLQSSIRCTDCFKEGHLADICPNKECEHCGAWATHESRFCPTWRRCERCRERGHDEVDCSASLRELASVVPCDLCASNQHTETNCDMIWKVPRPETGNGQIFVSVSCCYCASSQHLVGDCPRRPFRMNSSSWSLEKYNPSMVANLASLADLEGGDTAMRSGVPQYTIRGRANERMPSPDSDDALSRFGHSMPLKQAAPRTHIRFDAGIGRGRNPENDSRRQFHDSSGQFVPDGNGREYRDRDQYFAHNARQRSLSPVPYSSGRGRGRGRGNRGRPPPPRSPPPNRSSSNRGRPRARGGAGPRGRGKAPNAPSDRDNYRPLPSAGKKAWTKHRI